MPSKTHVENIKRLQEIFDKLDNQSIVKEELDELVRITANLHEKAVILRYKAAEERVFASTESKIETKSEPPEEKPVVEEKGEQEAIDFSIFEKKEPESVKEIDPISLPVDETKVVQKVSNNKVDWSKHFENVLKNHDSGLQTPLSSIAGSFGLNERILYTNELFNGEAEKFSSCVQELESIQDWSSCASALAKLAKDGNWESGNDAVDDFIIHVNRKYA